MKEIATIHTAFPEKFGIPRQSGLVETQGYIIFAPAYRNEECVRGLADYSHIWLLWSFSQNRKNSWAATVRPPRLGGNRRVGVFASRSPFRPNPIGLSCVRLDRIEFCAGKGPVLYVTGADLLDGTPILDIKPYLAYTDSHPEAVCGFADAVFDQALHVEWPEGLAPFLSNEQKEQIAALLRQDPRPSYQNDPARVYGMVFDGYEIRFSVCQTVVRIHSVEQTDKKK
ncbi:MAG: tRNA (N6-threonylcarbamoyladenosine(37)-N6)-methyltransferase TrmO [Clostridiales bacterium]|nr:tRNA (N6-threonylcarbamoyladenosine(37)-N6)-methyltransferase TrmO [Clostridiales bacterium]